MQMSAYGPLPPFMHDAAKVRLESSVILFASAASGAINNFYSYGFTDDNRKSVDALLRYFYEQGLSNSRLEVEDFFILPH
jgi:hypothetical protein